MQGLINLPVFTPMPVTANRNDCMFCMGYITSSLVSFDHFVIIVVDLCLFVVIWLLEAICPLDLFVNVVYIAVSLYVFVVVLCISVFIFISFCFLLVCLSS